ncbi:uncharacterized protein LOC143851867 [Tasmannia lanceolata]|uniref:uncharacterized protein LOC143851867 n=1 Tax=Tasmannia lanceolata TaxID=3420 RepID=UPI0040632326
MSVATVPQSPSSESVEVVERAPPRKRRRLFVEGGDGDSRDVQQPTELKDSSGASGSSVGAAPSESPARVSSAREAEIRNIRSGAVIRPGRVTCFRNTLGEGATEKIRREFHIPDGYEIRVPSSAEGVCEGTTEEEVAFYVEAFRAGVRFPLLGIIVEALEFYLVAPSQLAPNSWRTLLAFVAKAGLHKVQPTLPLLRACVALSLLVKGADSWLYLTQRPQVKIAANLPSSIKKWKEEYVFITPPLDVGWDFPRSWRRSVEWRRKSLPDESDYSKFDLGKLSSGEAIDVSEFRWERGLKRLGLLRAVERRARCMGERTGESSASYRGSMSSSSDAGKGKGIVAATKGLASRKKIPSYFMAAARLGRLQARLPASVPSSPSGQTVGEKGAARPSPPESEPSAKRVVPFSTRQGDAGCAAHPSAFTEDAPSRMEGAVMTKLLLERVELPLQQARGELFKPDWKIGIEDSVLANPRVGVELGVTTALPGDEAELEGFDRRALGAQYFQSTSCSQSYARRMVQCLLEDEAEIGVFEERVRQLSEDLDKARAEKAAFDDTVARLRADLRTTIEGRSSAEDKLAVACRTHARELAKVREEWRDSEEFLKAAAAFSVDIEIDAFAECRQRVQEVDPSFPLDKLMHEAEGGAS